ncbi:MAG: YifB family Mg chelatase-like AAA ATPase [Chloroflexota bacterium]|nr:YifB family Mg chelatase-like AAA ATPase [Chloroflexota bacterium]
MLAETLSASILGVDGALVRVEVDVAFGLPGLTIVGLAGSAVQEARERVRSAIRNSGFEVPARRITVNLAPADLRKDGTSYDVAIAVAILAASGQLKLAPSGVGLLGELALDGAIRPVAGGIALAAALHDAGIGEVIVAPENVAEAQCVTGLCVRRAARLADVVAHFSGVRTLAPAAPQPEPPARRPDSGVDLADVIGQTMARRALEIALAGRHNIALCGPPGVGKTMLLRSAPSLLPMLDDVEAIEVSRIYSVAGLVDRRAPLLRSRPYRAPHHTVSTQALVGGGPRVRPGEASLAHRGVLFLDEALQFRSDALDALREPLEAGSVAIARVDGAVRMPARFTLLTAFNPCPCGWLGASSGACRCDPQVARRYAAKLSGPLRDRLDLWVTMAEPRWTQVRHRDARESSVTVAERIRAAWQRQHSRQPASNAELSAGDLSARLGFSPGLLGALEQRGRRFRLSPRRLHRTAWIARTIADLSGAPQVDVVHLDEALHYRPEAAS